LKFSDTSTRQGIVQEIEGLLAMSATAISGDTTLLKDFTRRVNVRYSRVDHIIFESQGLWKYDDSNKTDLPIATTDIVNEQQNYALPDKSLDVDRIEIKDTDGNWSKLEAIDKTMVSEALPEFYKTAGLPLYYDLSARSIFLYPKPSTNDMAVSNALKVYFTRSSTSFTYTNTSTEPGFAQPFHPMLPIGAALDYCISYEIWEKANQLRAEWRDLEKGLRTHYARRHRELLPRIIPFEESGI